MNIKRLFWGCACIMSLIGFFALIISSEKEEVFCGVVVAKSDEVKAGKYNITAKREMGLKLDNGNTCVISNVDLIAFSQNNINDKVCFSLSKWDNTTETKPFIIEYSNMISIVLIILFIITAFGMLPKDILNDDY